MAYTCEGLQPIHETNDNHAALNNDNIAAQIVFGFAGEDFKARLLPASIAESVFEDKDF